MVLVSGLTYRIVQTQRGSYDAVRLLDDVLMGSFSSQAPFSVTSATGGDALLRSIAQGAMRGARTRWSTATGIG